MLDANVILSNPKEIIQSLIGRMISVHHTTFKKKDSCQRIRDIARVPQYNVWRLDCVNSDEHYFLNNPQLLLLVNNLLVKRVIETEQLVPPTRESHVSLQLQ